ncbi:MAG: hypothetical protein J5518_09895 [Lachnospiraceae bacterium]|nr:hypothetical protein [Lachnospiraceae bacterium]
MFLDLKYEDAYVKSVVIKPDPEEDPDTLHDYSTMLLVKNPAAGMHTNPISRGFNDCELLDHDLILARVKEFGTRFFDGKETVNVFQLAATLAEYILVNDYL